MYRLLLIASIQPHRVAVPIRAESLSIDTIVDIAKVQYIVDLTHTDSP